ncbi:MAG TPA: GNAT family N-acetyltransferase [Gaiellaceae bacterium]|nr:GNAT family N-acetyltransferase [Gaiellaceae bacterium]
MEVRKHSDAAGFLDRAEPLLLVDEARHSLMLGIACGQRKQAGLYDEFRGWTVEDGDDTVGAALQTPPFNVVLARPTSAGVLETLAATLASAGVELPGVTAATPEVDLFAELWTSAQSVALRTRTRQRIYRLTGVRAVAGVPGHPRVATDADRRLLVDWLQAFAAEALPEGAPNAGATRVVEARLDHGLGGFGVWEDGGRPVSVVGWGGSTPNGARIGPVYTPPELRRHGYASALTAWVSAERLAAGRSFCVLYTDLDNPTSNRIYTEIGYEPVCDSFDYAFEP